MIDETLKTMVWQHAQPVQGEDPALFRRDPYGNIMYRHSYRKVSTMGWNIDHIIPRRDGGATVLENLQAMNTQQNYKLRDMLNKRTRFA